MSVVTISRRDASEPSSSARSIFGLAPQSVQNRYLQRCTQICNEKAGIAASRHTITQKLTTIILLKGHVCNHLQSKTTYSFK